MKKCKNIVKKSIFDPKLAIFAPPKNDLMGQFFLQLLAKFKQKRVKKSKNMAEKCIFGQKGNFCNPQKRTEKTKITFSVKLIILELLAKFKQKRAKKSKHMAENRVFGEKKQKNRKIWPKMPFLA